jgi:hypothetical protein
MPTAVERLSRKRITIDGDGQAIGVREFVIEGTVEDVVPGTNGIPGPGAIFGAGAGAFMTFDRIDSAPLGENSGQVVVTVSYSSDGRGEVGRVGGRFDFPSPPPGLDPVPQPGQNTSVFIETVETPLVAGGFVLETIADSATTTVEVGTYKVAGTPGSPVAEVFVREERLILEQTCSLPGFIRINQLQQIAAQTNRLHNLPDIGLVLFAGIVSPIREDTAPQVTYRWIKDNGTPSPGNTRVGPIEGLSFPDFYSYEIVPRAADDNTALDNNPLYQAADKLRIPYHKLAYTARTVTETVGGEQIRIPSNGLVYNVREYEENTTTGGLLAWQTLPGSPFQGFY